MLTAKNNIIVKIKNTPEPEYAIMNPISGSFDMMGGNEYQLLEKLGKGEAVPGDFAAYLLERGYAFNSQDDQNIAIEKAYQEFNDEISQSQVQLMLVPTYGCNLACTYCFQHGVQGGSDTSTQVNSDKNVCKPSLISRDTVDAFFDYAESNFGQKKHTTLKTPKPFITLFGGEPLVNSPAQREIISYIVDKCVQYDYELAAVTNGFDFMEYVDILKKVRIKEIQFTLDGSKDIHDGRRATANKKGTFDRIIASIGAAVENGMPVNLRSVVDTENIEDIVNLSEYLDKKGWLDLPPELFKTQIGRNYELFECYAKPQHLMTQVELWGKFALLSKDFPILAKFHRPDFKGVRHIADTGEMYMASFDTCPACKTEWVFDLYGNIYGCTASCGREEYLLGTFWPEIRINEEAIDTWKNRDVKRIPACRDCKYDVICGGGCGVVAANCHGGDILSPDCRPVQELLEIGINHYIDDIKALSGEETDTASEKKSHGCMVCGTELIYSDNSTDKLQCKICGKEFESYIRCPKGHYICDNCHSLDILGKVEQLLAASNEADPVALAQTIFELPGLNMHGTEYHSIVPAILVSAWQNSKGQKDISRIKEAIKRGKDIKGGSCGLHGNCGAAVGSGIAVSVIEGATPLTKKERSAANRATGHALIEISRHGGPRCCKREAISSIKSFINVTHYFEDMKTKRYICKQYRKNKDCIGLKCPWFPVKIKIR